MVAAHHTIGFHPPSGTRRPVLLAILRVTGGEKLRSVRPRCINVW